MKTAVLCILLAPLLHAFTIPQPPSQAVQVQPEAVQVQNEDHSINKRFAGLTAMMLYNMMDDDDYIDDMRSLRRGRPSRRTIQLAQLIRQLAGTQGLTQGQLQNMQQNLQNLQLLQNLQQQQLQPQNLQGLTQQVG